VLLKFPETNSLGLKIGDKVEGFDQVGAKFWSAPCHCRKAIDR
jgi:hypothetical protein